MSVRDLLLEATSDLDDVGTRTGPDGDVTWSRAGRAFAVVSSDGSAAEFGLDAAVAAAAARTPDVEPSPRGLGWVRFRPAVLDGHAVDRAEAWFASAHRRLSRR